MSDDMRCAWRQALTARRRLQGRPRDPAALHAKARALVLLGELHAAERTYRRALAEEPWNPAFQHELGLVLVDLHRFDEAMEALGAALAIRPHDEDFAQSYAAISAAIVYTALRRQQPLTSGA